MAAYPRCRSGALLLLVCAGAGAASAPTEPTQVDYTESVTVHLIQVEVTVWPPAGDPDRCLGLTKDDFRLTVDRRPRPIEAVDWLGASAAAGATEPTRAEDPARQPMRIVLYFDLWHLNLFFRGYTCPVTKPLAFDEARRMVREEFVAGDHLLLVTFAGWPRVHYGWIDDPDEALAALDRLEVSPFVLSARTEHSHERPWIDGMQSLLLALGRYPGPKELIYLGDDFRFGEIASRVDELAARAQANRVAIHAVDLLASCRSVPGPGDGLMCPPTGGLRCTPFRVPVALGPMSWNTGGQLFGTSSIAAAVHEVREARACRYVVSFRSDSDQERRSVPRAIVKLNREGLTLRAPVSFQNPKRPPAEREELDALSLLPQFGRGLLVEAGLWPLRPDAGKNKRWNTLLLVRLGASGEPWPEELAEIVVEAAVVVGGRAHAEFRRTVSGEELASLRTSDRPRLFAFPVEGVRPGEATIAVRARGVAPDGEIVANVRDFYTVPKPPGPGQTRPWYLADRMARVGESVTLLPSLDGLLSSDHAAVVVGYGCVDAESPPGGERRGRLVAESDAVPVNVPIEWLDGRPPEPADGCGWLVGRVGPDLEPGLWRFEPPDASDAERTEVMFRVVRSGP